MKKGLMVAVLWVMLLIGLIGMSSATADDQDKAASVTYDYTGQPFTFVMGDVTTSQFITASATFTDPVFPATSVAPSSFSISFGGPGLPSFSLTEEDVVIFADFNFDASGDITSWRLYVSRLSGSSPTIWSELRTEAGPLNDPFPDGDILHVFVTLPDPNPHSIHGGRSNVPGAWVRRVPAPSVASSIHSNFNGTAIAAGNSIWFNSVLKVKGVGTEPVTIRFVDSTIDFAVGTTNYHVAVPNAVVTISPEATLATVPARVGAMIDQVFHPVWAWLCFSLDSVLWLGRNSATGHVAL